MTIGQLFSRSKLSRIILLVASAFAFCACSTSVFEQDLAHDQKTAIRLGKKFCYGSEEKFDAAFPKCEWRAFETKTTWELHCGYYWTRRLDHPWAEAFMVKVERHDGAASMCLVFG